MYNLVLSLMLAFCIHGMRNQVTNMMITFYCYYQSTDAGIMRAAEEHMT